MQFLPGIVFSLPPNKWTSDLFKSVETAKPRCSLDFTGQPKTLFVGGAVLVSKHSECSGTSLHAKGTAVWHAEGPRHNTHHLLGRAIAGQS